MTTFLQLTPQAHELLVDCAPVGLDLRLARAADKAKPAALPLEVGPRPHEARTLIAQRRHLDLQYAFSGRRPVAENLQDQPGPVEDLDIPGLLQIALLHRRQRAIDKHKVRLGGADCLFQFLALALAKEPPSIGLTQPHDLCARDLQIRQRLGERDSLFESKFRVARPVGADNLGVDDPGPGDRACMFLQLASSPS